MPELPEVETTVKGLNKKVIGRTFIDVWSDFKKILKKPKNFEKFKKEIKGRKIEKIWRRGKNIIFNLSENRSLLIHQKLTGHLLYGKWTPTHPRTGRSASRKRLASRPPSRRRRAPVEKGKWVSEIPGPLKDPMNRFLHLVFWLDNGWQLALSDLRKFAKVELWDSQELFESEEIKSLGPEPLKEDFTVEKFKEVLIKKKGKIKQVLMDQTVIAGIGNIYSDEILWQAKIHPFKEIKELNDEEIERIYQAMRKILPKAIEVGGESISDYRKPSGEKGGFDFLRKVYRRESEKCSRCSEIIKRVKLAGRSAHFCPRCQKL